MDYVSRTLKARREADRNTTAKWLIAIALCGFLGFLAGGF